VSNRDFRTTTLAEGEMTGSSSVSRERQQRRHGPVIWITGLSAAGKSTVANELSGRLRAEGVPVVLLDGNEMREALGVVGAFDSGSRRRLGLTYGRLCKMLSRQGHTVICATISLYHEVHAWNRRNIARYFEVLLDAPLDELARRDFRGIYRGDRAGDVVGLGLAAEFPKAPDLVVPNFGEVTPTTVAKRIHQFCASAEAW
jgi:adenylylsulfate kinase-like enzyme